ncbi:ECF transporter S component [Candidatus Woesearchaeota archaeon]|nr:ECF transporter S component [Candidatus Woesearchaeota archaeon]
MKSKTIRDASIRDTSGRTEKHENHDTRADHRRMEDRKNEHRKQNNYLIYSIAAMLSGISIIFQLMPFWPTTWGMRIDLVTVPWIIALFLFGWKASSLTSILSAIFIGFIAVSSWLGAGMKLLATACILVPLMISYDIRKRKFHHLWAMMLLGLILRSVVMLYINYHFALPIWLHLPTEEIMTKFPWYFLVIPNLVQSIVEILAAYAIVFRTKLKTYISA